MAKCKWQTIDNLDYTNCTKGNGHIGLCQQPCPYGKHLHRQLAQYTYISGYAKTKLNSVKTVQNKLQSAIFESTYINIVASDGDS